MADVELLELNGALLNVIRTESTDVNVTSLDGATQYTRGVDYEVVDSPVNNTARAQDLVAAWGRNESYVLRAGTGGHTRLREGQTVSVSYDFLAGMVGQINDGSHPNCFAEERYYEIMSQVITYAMYEFGAKKVFFGFDEMHGINRDSRSRRAGRTNSEAIAWAMNKLAGLVRERDPLARSLFWADMINPWHNAARPHYQQANGGIAGATSHAAPLLDKSIIHVPWWYGGYETSPTVPCFTANTAKDCTDPPVQCDNVKCAMDNDPALYDSLGADWLAAGGTTAENLGDWGSLQHGHTHALGMMTTQWHHPDPITTGIPFAGEFGWNQKHTQQNADCA